MPTFVVPDVGRLRIFARFRPNLRKPLDVRGQALRGRAGYCWSAGTVQRQRDGLSNSLGGSDGLAVFNKGVLHGRLHIAVFEQVCDHRQRDARHDGLVGVRELPISSQDSDAKPCQQGVRKGEGMSIAGAFPRSVEVQRAALFVILCVSQLEL